MAENTRAAIVLDLFERYYERVFRFSRRTLDASAAEDIAQEVFVRLLNCEGLESKSIGSSYLVKIADNLIKRRYRQTQRRERMLEEHRRGVSGQTGREESGIGRLERYEMKQRCDASYRSLGAREQDAVRFIVGGDLTYQNAASSLGVNVTAVNNWKYRGIQRIKNHCAGERGERAPSADRPGASDRSESGGDSRGQRAG
ncbi:MAG: sigma-70 family RNA polymerase sigma factor [Planctomycetota bacterium]